MDVYLGASVVPPRPVAVSMVLPKEIEAAEILHSVFVPLPDI
jgi:hypothetical protein